MPVRVPPTLLALAALLGGCLGGSTGDGVTQPTPGATDERAPWWEVGEWWTITFEQEGRAPRTVELVNFGNNTFGDPPHFWLGTRDRQEALDQVFFEVNPFLGRIHWESLAPHEKGMHSQLYAFPLRDGAEWDTGILFGQEEIRVAARGEAGGAFEVSGQNRDGARASYDYEPDIRWFKHLEITQDGQLVIRATTTGHGVDAKGTFYFLRGRDYLDSDGGSTGDEEAFTVKDEGATSIAFLLNVQASGLGPVSAAAIEFVAPSGEVWHRETLASGATTDKVVEVSKAPPPGAWKIRYVGTVTGTILVRGVIEYKATI